MADGEEGHRQAKLAHAHVIWDVVWETTSGLQLVARCLPPLNFLPLYL